MRDYFSFVMSLKACDYLKLPLVIISEKEVPFANEIISSALEKVVDKSLCDQFAKCIVTGLREE